MPRRSPRCQLTQKASYHGIIRGHNRQKLVVTPKPQRLPSVTAGLLNSYFFYFTAASISGVISFRDGSNLPHAFSGANPCPVRLRLTQRFARPPHYLFIPSERLCS